MGRALEGCAEVVVSLSILKQRTEIVEEEMILLIHMTTSFLGLDQHSRQTQARLGSLNLFRFERVTCGKKWEGGSAMNPRLHC